MNKVIKGYAVPYIKGYAVPYILPALASFVLPQPLFAWYCRYYAVKLGISIYAYCNEYYHFYGFKTPEQARRAAATDPY